MNGKGIVGVCGAEPLEFPETISAKTESAPFINYTLEQRTHPENLLKDAESIIVVGLGYNRERVYEDDGQARGRFSLGAIGLDYHIVLRKLLDDMEDAILREGYVFNSYKSVDTGPLPEKHLAVKAGLGWLGRNGLVISDELGSFFNIGYMLTTIHLEELKDLVSDRIDFSQGLYCGECNQCVKACPGGALVYEPDKIKFDYKRCVSYLTQKKGRLTEEESRNAGINLYGCDICQNACDYNRGAYAGKITDIELAAPKLEDILTLTKDGFKERYKSTAVYWRGLNVLKRNASRAMENFYRIKDLFEQ